MLGWQMFSNWMNNVVTYLPNLITGLLIILAGFLLSNGARSVVISTAHSAGIEQGRRHDLVGGGLVRSAGGWQKLTSLRQERSHLKSDERILGDSEFVESVLGSADEQIEEMSQCRSEYVEVNDLVQIAAEKIRITPDEIWTGGKQPKRVAARSLLCFWAVRELGRTTTEIGLQLGMSQSAVSRAVQRGEQLARENGWYLAESTNA